MKEYLNKAAAYLRSLPDPSEETYFAVGVGGLAAVLLGIAYGSGAITSVGLIFAVGGLAAWLETRDVS